MSRSQTNSEREVKELIELRSRLAELEKSDQERTKALAALQESEAKYMAFVENSKDGIIIIQDRRLKFVNQEVCNYMQYTREEILDKDFRMLVAPSSRALVMRRYLARMAGMDVPNRYEIDLVRKDGELIIAELSMVIITYEGRKADLAFIRNVTERKHMEEALRSARDDLEERVAERTAELAVINTQMAEEIAERKRADEDLRRSYMKLQIALNSTVQAIATIVESRDPYTAGHQRRVARLCVAIGTELGLEAKQLEGLRVAATVHDIGKIYVPAEILSKPGQLRDIEYMLIKGHADVGYTILKDIEFPWPIAEMVLQHHERIDGTGYPAGLKGDAILLEARILGVADVVEAMSSHRPYRPALGVDKALEEITSKSGICYDAAVVDACLTAIRENGFSFK